MDENVDDLLEGIPVYPENNGTGDEARNQRPVDNRLVRNISEEYLNSIVVILRKGYAKHGRLYLNFMRNIFATYLYFMESTDYLLDVDFEAQLKRFIAYGKKPFDGFPMRIEGDAHNMILVCDHRVAYAKKIGMTDLWAGDWRVWHEHLVEKCKRLLKKYPHYFPKILHVFIMEQNKPLGATFIDHSIRPIYLLFYPAADPNPPRTDEGEVIVDYDPYADRGSLNAIEWFTWNPACGFLLATLDNFLLGAATALSRIDEFVIPISIPIEYQEMQIKMKIYEMKKIEEERIKMVKYRRGRRPNQTYTCKAVKPTEPSSSTKDTTTPRESDIPGPSHIDDPTTSMANLKIQHSD